MTMDLSKWLPMSPLQGPPLPAFLKITWPWVFDPWRYATSYTENGKAYEVIDERSFSAAVADSTAGKITKEQLQQVIDLFGKPREMG